jgi:alkylated DNA nucleotide flippase Atl1
MVTKNTADKWTETNKKDGLQIKKETPKGLMYISSPKEILEEIKKIPRGKVISTTELAHKLSRKHKTDYTCGLTTGIFLAIIANYVEESGLKDVPYWRVTKAKGEIYPSYLREPSFQADYLAQEGVEIEERKTGKLFVKTR